MNILFFLKPKSELAYIHDYYSVRQTMEIMEYHKYSCIPILDREGHYIGSITEGDLLWGIKRDNLIRMKDAESVNIMRIPRRADYYCVRNDARMEDLIERSMEQNFVPVVDDEKRFIGIVTRRDIIGYCYRKLKECTGDDH